MLLEEKSLKIVLHSPEFLVEEALAAIFEQKVSNLLTDEIKEKILDHNPAELFKLLPIFGTVISNNAFWVSFLCPWEYTLGVGRYIDDILRQWLIPGKVLSITSSLRFSFSFVTLMAQRFFFGYSVLDLNSPHEREIAERNVKRLLDEMRLNIKAVYHTRYITSLKSLSLEHRHSMIKENINQIFNIPQSDYAISLFDQMDRFLMRLDREEKVNEIQQIIEDKTKSRPKAFDRGMFAEMTYFTILFTDQFTARRSSRHITRIISLHYLFKKLLLHVVKNPIRERHMGVRVYKTKLNGELPVLGILFGVNILKESERLNQQFILSAIRSCMPQIEFVKDSYLSDQREKEIFLSYLEIHKPSFEPFNFKEIDLLRKKLPLELKKQIENEVHPVFFPRNEEEIARNLILLSQQLKYNRDLPQVSIHYEKQSESELLFSIRMARLLHPTVKSLRELIISGESDLKLSIDEVREIGKLKRKIPKEISILRASLKKAPFFRADHSVDLLRARQRLAYELTKVIGEYRDFNGGMFLKQEESLHALRNAIGTMSQETEFLLENYFYSLEPGIMQTILPTEVLKTHFELLIKLQANPTSIFFEDKKDSFFFFFRRLGHPALKEMIKIHIERLRIPSFEIINCFLQFPAQFSYCPAVMHDGPHHLTESATGYIYRSEKDSDTLQNLKVTLSMDCNSLLRTTERP